MSDFKIILIAEDDENIRTILSIMLSDLGYIIICAENGKLAYAILNNNKNISMLITDMMMPEMGGRELTEIVRGNSQFGDLPIIIISAVVGPKEIHDLLNLGATAFLPKPVDSDMLRETVATCFKEN